MLGHWDRPTTSIVFDCDVTVEVLEPDRQALVRLIATHLSAFRPQLTRTTICFAHE
jgi:hypothetical protein